MGKDEDKGKKTCDAVAPGHHTDDKGAPLGTPCLSCIIQYDLWIRSFIHSFIDIFIVFFFNLEEIDPCLIQEQ